MATRNVHYMKVLDMIAAILLFIGGINWGLVGVFNFNLMEYIFGSPSFVVRFIYLLVGISALYDAVMWKAIQRRWQCTGFFGRAQTMAT